MSYLLYLVLFILPQINYLFSMHEVDCCSFSVCLLKALFFVFRTNLVIKTSFFSLVTLVFAFSIPNYPLNWNQTIFLTKCLYLSTFLEILPGYFACWSDVTVSIGPSFCSVTEWIVSKARTAFQTPWSIPWIKPRMYVRRNIMYEYAAFCSPEEYSSAAL